MNRIDKIAETVVKHHAITRRLSDVLLGVALASFIALAVFALGGCAARDQIGLPAVGGPVVSPPHWPQYHSRHVRYVYPESQALALTQREG